MNQVSAILERCKENMRALPPETAFVDAQDERIIRLARSLKKQGLAQPVLVGDKGRISQLAEQNRLSLAGIKLRQPIHDPRFVYRLKDFRTRAQKWGLGRLKAELLFKSALWYGADFLQQAQADLVLGGNATPVGEYVRAGLRVLTRDREWISSFYLLASPDQRQIIAFADGCLTPRPNSEQLARIAVNTADAYQAITSQQPLVALLSFSTQGSARHELVDKVRRTVRLIHDLRPDLTVDGELQFDAATVSEVAQKKAPHSPLAGKANVLIFPSLQAANIGYKLAHYLANWKLWGPFFVGFKKAWHGLYPTGEVEDWLNTVVLADCLRKQL